MFLALELFLIREFLARRRDLVLRLEMGGIRPGRFGAGLARLAEAAPHPADLQSRRKTFEITLLLVGEVD